MQLTLSKLFAFIVAAQAIGIVGAVPIVNSTVSVPDNAAHKLVPQDFNVGIICTDNFLGGTCAVINVGGIPSGCRNVVAQFNDQFSSIQVNAGISCQFFVDASCQGAALTVSGSTVNDLAGTNFQDSISSDSCFCNDTAGSAGAATALAVDDLSEKVSLFSGSRDWDEDVSDGRDDGGEGVHSKI
ncbi:hypothetical protein C8J56DRAFT_1048718 [Mycena floridula]|nr:hypothetical protein C8J56DRAFT_1048718 [Mycena floridula]